MIRDLNNIILNIRKGHKGGEMRSQRDHRRGNGAASEKVSESINI